ncbi:MAG: hypothetical protein ACOY3P_11465 [Planctomycetota bacterium]
MFSKFLDMVTAKDDIERIAAGGNAEELNQLLKIRPLLVPKRPRQFLDPVTMTPEQLADMTRQEADDASGEDFEPWILELNGKKCLPAFSSEKNAAVFARRISQDLNKVFGLAYIKILLFHQTKNIDVDYVELNLFSKRSWRIEIGKPTSG